MGCVGGGSHVGSWGHELEPLKECQNTHEVWDHGCQEVEGMGAIGCSGRSGRAGRPERAGMRRGPLQSSDIGKTAPDGECVIDGHWCWQRKNGLDWQLVGAVEAMRAFLRE